MAFIGYKIGLVRTLLSFSSHVISLIFSWFLYPIVSKIIMKTSIFSRLSDLARKNIATLNLGESIENISLDQVLGQFKLPYSIIKFLNSVLRNVSGNIYDVLAGKMVNVFINILSMLIIFVFCRIFIRFFFAIFDLFARLPVIKQFNKLGGGIFGIIQGVFIVYLILAFFTVPLMMKKSLRIHEQIDASFVTKEMYYNNLIFRFFLPKYLSKQ
jgi:hypothetical protein